MIDEFCDKIRHTITAQHIFYTLLGTISLSENEVNKKSHRRMAVGFITKSSATILSCL